jgi:hypothetical protein
VIRLAGLLLAVAATALAGPVVQLVDGRELSFARLVSAGPDQARLELGSVVFEVPTVNLVSVVLPLEEPDLGDGPINLYLTNGDRLRGTVRGEGDALALEGKGVEGLKVPLGAVRAVRFGRLLGGLQARYGEVFESEMKRGRDVVVVQRDTRPFPIPARVLAVREQSLTVLVGDARRELPAHKVYGFVRALDPTERKTGDALQVCVHLRGGGRVTLPLEQVTAEEILGGGARVQRSEAVRLEFLCNRLAHLGELDPISVKEVALFGKAPRWQRDRMVLGGPLQMDGRRYEHGLGVHAYSRLEFVLGTRWNSFFVRCGIDDAAGREGAALFRVLGDGKVLVEVERRRGQGSEPVLVDVAGVDRLVLEAAPGDSYTSDFCDWAEARVFNAEPMEDIPSGGEE